MKLARFNDNRLGLVDGDNFIDVTSALDALPSYKYPAPTTDAFITNLEMLKPRILEAAKTGAKTPIKGATLLSPVANPGKVVAAPVNYQAHYDEAEFDPGIRHGKEIVKIQTIGLFLKATSSIVGASHGVELVHLDRRNDHEIELVAIIGKAARNVKKEDAFKYIAGYCIGLDMTVRGAEERSMRKSIDTFTVMGPWMVTPDEIADPHNLDLTLTVNGQPRQSNNTKNLIIKIHELIEWASIYYTLRPGDLFMTGTPDGVGPVVPGDKIDARITSIGSMQVDVRAQKVA
jgi:2-keto-4-pentenoate hydratase/2-oxohepta-3-ene-1,7-dioic acid hydratase in catechol pathway